MDLAFDGVAQGPARFRYADARGSIVLNTKHDGTNAQINTYDAYGVPGTTNTGRFQYTGQVWLAELGMNYYKARMYSPQLGRFMQTDPIGYEDNVNLYGYVGNDPINGVDFDGKKCTPAGKMITCKPTFNKPIEKMTKDEKAQAVKATKAYTIAAAKAKIAPDRGQSVLVKGPNDKKTFRVKASEIRDELFESDVKLNFGEDTKNNAYMSNPPPPLFNTIQVWQNGLNQSLNHMTKSFLHEGIHNTPSEKAAHGGAATSNGHTRGYNRAAEEIFRTTPKIDVKNIRHLSQGVAR